jgi:hypothetical protein
MRNTAFVILGVDGKSLVMSPDGHICHHEGGFHKGLLMVGWKIVC